MLTTISSAKTPSAIQHKSKSTSREVSERALTDLNNIGDNERCGRIDCFKGFESAYNLLNCSHQSRLLSEICPIHYEPRPQQTQGRSSIRGSRQQVRLKTFKQFGTMSKDSVAEEQ
jgi:hypothetical protein